MSVVNAARVRAPELSGDVWLNTGGTPLRLAELRGRIVLLDFWTSGCVNCLHVLAELAELEREFADVLVTIGVHCPKFAHEADAAAVQAAVERYGVRHPVVSDPELATWQQYAVKAWPTLVVVDPEGYVVHVASGQGHAAALRRVLADIVSVHEAKDTLRRGGNTEVAVAAESDPDAAAASTGDTELRFPAKAVVTAEGRVLVADTAHHSIAEFASDAETLVRRFGSGVRGDADGVFDVARFAGPSGLTLLPPETAERAGYHLVVADTGNHRLRGVDLRTGTVRTVAGTGRQWRADTDMDPDPAPAREADLTSPWDVCWWDAAAGVVVALAGNHTLSVFDPVAGTIAPLAGAGVEGLRDGAAEEAFFAQPSGLAAAGPTLWLVDAETSALRRIERDSQEHDGGFRVETVVGTDLFAFGHLDGAAATALLQHPLGLAVLPDGTIAVADTYNGAIRRYNPVLDTVATLARDLAEPSGVAVTDGGVLVVESAAHRLRPLDAGPRPATGDGGDVLVAPTRPELQLVPAGASTGAEP